MLRRSVIREGGQQGYTMFGPTSYFIDTIRLGWAMTRLGLEAQEVVALRITGLAGLWAMPPDEATRMVAEKAPAFLDAWSRGAEALTNGASSSAALDASLRPLHRQARANKRRLSSRARR